MGRLRQAALVLALVLVALYANGSTQASTDDPMRENLERTANGRYSLADLALIRASQAIAAQMPDPTFPIQSGSRSGRNPTGRPGRGSCGYWVDVWYRQRSLLGATIYTWHHHVVYCLNRGRVSRWQNRYDYLTDASSIVYFRERLVSQQAGLHTASAWSHIQRHLEYCIIKYGCYANTYPWSKITVYGGGGYDYTGSAT